MTASFIYAITIEPSDKIFVSSWANGIFMSTDGGNSWNSLSLFGFGVTTVMLNPNSNSLFVGTSDGSIYVTSLTTSIDEMKAELSTEISLI
jgi:WD40 repeat protein